MPLEEIAFFLLGIAILAILSAYFPVESASSQILGIVIIAVVGLFFLRLFGHLGNIRVGR